MKRARVIPVLLLKGKGLYKTEQFKNERYVGDPVNAVRIFNEKQCDELILLDINASKTGAPIDFRFIADITSECFMPLAYGGGITALGEIDELLKIGIEKVILNSVLIKNPHFLKEAVRKFGSSTIVASVDIKTNLLKQYQVYSHANYEVKQKSMNSFIKQIEGDGAGELMINSVDRDGMMNGYDLQLAEKASKGLAIPTIICGGCKNLEDIKSLLTTTEASAAAVGSLFVFKGPHRGVLISYPSPEEIEAIYN